MKKYIPNPIRESLKFKPEVGLNKSSTNGSLDWAPVGSGRRVLFTEARAQRSYKDENHTPGNRSKEEHATGTGTIIAGNHPRSGEAVYDAETGAFDVS